MKPVVFLFTLLLLLGALVAQPPSQVPAEQRDVEFWESLTLRDRRLYVEAFAAGQLALLPDLRPQGDEFLQQVYGLTILETSVDHIISHVDEIYEVPGYRHVPLAVTVQLAHHYAWQVRQGFTSPLTMKEEDEVKERMQQRW